MKGEPLGRWWDIRVAGERAAAREQRGPASLGSRPAQVRGHMLELKLAPSGAQLSTVTDHRPGTHYVPSALESAAGAPQLCSRLCLAQSWGH